MGSKIDGNAFDAFFLSSFDPLDEPAASALEGELAGPWRAVAVEGGYAVFREEEGPGDPPEACFTDRQEALLAVSVLPAVGREPLYRLGGERGPEGRFPLQGGALSPAVEGRPREGASREREETFAFTADEVGSLRHFRPELAGALHLAAALVRSPRALAALMEAAGATVLERAGQILLRRVEARERAAGDLEEQARELLASPRLGDSRRRELEELAEGWKRSVLEEAPDLPRLGRRLEAAQRALRRAAARLHALSEDSDALRRAGEVKAAYLADLAGAAGALAAEASDRLARGGDPDAETLRNWRRQMEALDARLAGGGRSGAVGPGEEGS